VAEDSQNFLNISVALFKARVSESVPTNKPLHIRRKNDMARYIAILTLALTAALSADQAVAADVTQDTYIIRNLTAEGPVNQTIEPEFLFVMMEFEREYEFLVELGFRPYEAVKIILSWQDGGVTAEDDWETPVA